MKTIIGSKQVHSGDIETMKEYLKSERGNLRRYQDNRKFLAETMKRLESWFSSAGINPPELQALKKAHLGMRQFFRKTKDLL